MELVQLRWYAGQLQYRQRMAHEGRCYFASVNELIVLDQWTEWQTVPGVKGDDSDKRFD